jgi:hypothetical protein
LFPSFEKEEEGLECAAGLYQLASLYNRRTLKKILEHPPQGQVRKKLELLRCWSQPV